MLIDLRVAIQTIRSEDEVERLKDGRFTDVVVADQNHVIGKKERGLPYPAKVLYAQSGSFHNYANVRSSGTDCQLSAVSRTLSSPEISLGSMVSRRATRMLDSRRHSRVRASRLSAPRSKAETTGGAGMTTGSWRMDS